MSPLVVYGDPATSRTWWTIWMCQELAIDFENKRLHFLDPYLKSEEFRRVNPNGMVPAIVDGQFHLSEAMAINLYLAKRFKRGLYPVEPENEALAWQWSFWAVSPIEPPLYALQVAGQSFAENSEVQRYYQRKLPRLDAAEIERCRVLLDSYLQVLNDHLESRPYLLGETFTVADLNVASMLGRLRHARVSLHKQPRTADWLARCWSREACPLGEQLIQALAAIR